MEDKDLRDLDWSGLSKRERKKLVKERKRQEAIIEKKKANFGKWIGIAIIIGVILLGGAWVGKGIVREVSKPLPGKLLADLGREHIPQSQWEKFKYNSNPPTSGPHDPEWIRAGVYDTPQGDGHLIHSLEHGYIIISYRCEDQDKNCLDFVDKLKEKVKKDSWKFILVPRPNLDTNFALTAWRRIDKFDLREASMDRVNSFVKAFRNHGPEQTME